MLDLLLGCALVATTAAAPASDRVKADFPAPTPADCDKRFKAYDANQDGALTYKEYVEGQWGQLRFGTVPSEALIQGHKRRYAQQASLADANKDGKLSPAEHRRLCQAGLDGP